MSRTRITNTAPHSKKKYVTWGVSLTAEEETALDTLRGGASRSAHIRAALEMLYPSAFGVEQPAEYYGFDADDAV